MSLEMKYFVLKPEGQTLYHEASRKAMAVYAEHIKEEDKILSLDLIAWIKQAEKPPKRNVREHTETWQEIADKWENGDDIWSAELGGIGPQYEMCIQELLFSILVCTPKGTIYDKDLEEYPKDFTARVDELATGHGLSGAQVGQAKSTAYSFIAHGYSHMMNKLPEDRFLLVSKPKH